MKPSNIKFFIPLLVIIILMALAYSFAYFYPVSWENLKSMHLSLKYFADSHSILTPLLFMGIYILYALLSLPGIFILALFAGFLFAQPFSTLYVMIASTLGATFLFLAARTAFGQLFYRKSAIPFYDKMEQGFQENAINYLLCLRLIPLFPFCIVNLAGAFFQAPFWTFVWTTFIGMIPSIFIYTQAGKGLTFLLYSPDPLNPTSLFNAPLVMALMGLALLSLLPILFKQKN